MTDHEANHLRCAAHEILVRLHESARRDEIELLRIHAVRSIEEIDRELAITPERPLVAA
jgi:hypothetical protein